MREHVRIVAVDDTGDGVIIPTLGLVESEIDTSKRGLAWLGIVQYAKNTYWRMRSDFTVKQNVISVDVWAGDSLLYSYGRYGEFFADPGEAGDSPEEKGASRSA